MTPEQLDEIEKLAEAWRAMSLHRLVAEVMVPMTTALREAWKERDEARAALDEREGDMHARIRAGYDKTVADSWRAHCAKIEKERDEARAEVERLRDLIDTVIRNCMECYDKRECQSCAWLREGTEKKR